MKNELEYIARELRKLRDNNYKNIQTVEQNEIDKWSAEWMEKTRRELEKQGWIPAGNKNEVF